MIVAWSEYVQITVTAVTAVTADRKIEPERMPGGVEITNRL
jgi:hypothetical protein